MKKVLLALGAVVLVLIIAAVAMLASIFGGMVPLPDGGKDLPGGVRLIKDGYVSMYLLPGGDGSFGLIDCGNDPKGEALLAELKRQNLEVGAVKTIFLTHGHPDHIAACHLFPTAEVYGFQADEGIANQTQKPKGPLPAIMGFKPALATKMTKMLTDGQVVNVGSLQVKAFAVPGHTAGSASYLAGGVLVMGDNATAESGGALRPAPWLFSDDTAQNQASLRALAKRLVAENDTVLMTAYAHSGPTEGMKVLQSY